MITIDDYWLSFAVAIVLPALVALTTRQFASSALKSIVLLFLSALSGALTSIQVAGGTFDWRTALTSFFVTFITAVVSHYGLLKPVGVTGSEGVVSRKIPTGVGGKARHRA